MTISTFQRWRRGYKILRLFFSLLLSFLFQYLAARFAGRSYDFFEDSKRNRKRAIRIRNTALEMGGVLIKVGQFLSSRVDLLPSEYIEELALLQDEVPGVPFENIRAVVERELGGPLHELFLEFDPEAVAAASLGQVHRAQLRTGQMVAVKVQRPGIDAIVNADLGSVRYIVHWLDRHTPVHRRTDLPAVLREFEETLRLELDYRREGHHAERLAISFAANDAIAIPRIFWSYSTDRVLTLQYMRGIKVTDFPELERLGISRSGVAEVLTRAYLKQVLSDGFFHADPHPGNILVQPGPRVVLLDFGMVGELSSQVRENIRQIFLGVIRRDFEEVVAALMRLGFVTRDADTRALERAIAWTVDTFYEISFGELRTLDPQYVIDELQDVLFSESVRVPANYAFLGRALGTLSGLCTALDPSFQFFTVAEPYARELIRADLSVRATIGTVVSEVRSIATTSYSLLFLTRRMLDEARSSEASFEHQFVGVISAVERLERTGRKVLRAILVAGFLIAGSLLQQAHYHVLAVISFALAAAYFIGLFVPNRRRR